MGDEAAVLLSAVSGLVPFAPPEQAIRTLRHALIELLEPGQGTPDAPGVAPPATIAVLREDLRGPRPSRDRYTGQPGLAAWLPVRNRVLGSLTASGMSRQELASELGIGLTTLKAGLMRRCRVPGEGNRAKIESWLERAAKSNGASEPAPGASAPPPYRLTAAQREKLAGYRQLDERSLRKSAGVTLETVDAAIAGGRDLAPEIVAKLALFLDQQQPAAE